MASLISELEAAIQESWKQKTFRIAVIAFASIVIGIGVFFVIDKKENDQEKLQNIYGEMQKMQDSAKLEIRGMYPSGKYDAVVIQSVENEAAVKVRTSPRYEYLSKQAQKMESKVNVVMPFFIGALIIVVGIIMTHITLYALTRVKFSDAKALTFMPYTIPIVFCAVLYVFIQMFSIFVKGFT